MEDEPATEILRATRRALCDHGYADLTVRDVAAEAETSEASVHYHYGCKDDLFAALLDHLAERYAERVAAATGDTPRERLDSTLEALLTDRAGPDGSSRELRTATVEMAAQAPYDGTVRERLADCDESLTERLREIIAAGANAGEFDGDADPALAAELLVTAIAGAHVRQVAVDRSLDRFSDAMTEYAERRLFADGSTEVAN